MSMEQRRQEAILRERRERESLKNTPSERRAEVAYRKKQGLISLEDEMKARERLAKRLNKGYSLGLLASTGAIGAVFRARGLGKDKRLYQALERLERDQDRREARGEAVYRE